MTLPASVERLLAALAAENAPASMVKAARAGAYHDFLSDSATPIHDLMIAAHAAGLHGLAYRARAGEFDAPMDEAEAWAQSQTGTMAKIIASMRSPRGEGSL